MSDAAIPHPVDSPWRHGAFLRFWFASAGTSFGFQMMSVAVGWQVYAITGRAFDLGLVGLVQFLPSLLLALPAGHAADRYSRQRIVVATQVVVFVAIGLLALSTATTPIGERTIFVILFAIGVATAMKGPAQSAMLPALVPASILPQAMALSSSGWQAAAIVGPALGGLLYAFGPTTVYVVAAALYGASALLMTSVRYRQAPLAREPATLATVFAGVRFIREHPDVLGVISLDLFAVLLGGATALLPIFAKDVLHTGPLGLGLLRGAPAVGGLLMAAWLSRRAIEHRVGSAMFASVAVFGVATIAFGLSSSMAWSLAALLVLGAADMVSVVIRTALVQLDTPDAMRGRVNGVNAIFINTSNQLGEFESGLLAAWIGAVPAVLVGGVGTVVVVGLWMALFPTLRRRQRLQSASAPDAPTTAAPADTV